MLQCHRAAVDPLRMDLTSSWEMSHRSLTRSQTNKTLARVSKVLPSRFLPTTRYEIAVETCVPSRLNRKSSSFECTVVVQFRERLLYNARNRGPFAKSAVTTFLPRFTVR
jgi:hypothetical protein